MTWSGDGWHQPDPGSHTHVDDSYVAGPDEDDLAPNERPGFATWLPDTDAVPLLPRSVVEGRLRLAEHVGARVDLQWWDESELTIRRTWLAYRSVNQAEVGFVSGSYPAATLWSGPESSVRHEVPTHQVVYCAINLWDRCPRCNVDPLDPGYYVRGERLCLHCVQDLSERAGQS